MATAEQNARLESFSPLAVSCEQRFGIPAEFTCAQWIIESSYGARETGRNNAFGIKRAARHVGWDWCRTKEYMSTVQISNALAAGFIRNVKFLERGPTGAMISCEAQFAAFDSPQAAVDDRAVLLTTGKPYADAWAKFRASGDRQQYMRDVAAKYATDPTYPTLVVAIANQKNVTEACQRARSNLKEAHA